PLDAREQERIPRRPVGGGVADEGEAVAHRQSGPHPAVEERVAERESDAPAQVERLGAPVGEDEREPQGERDKADPERATRVEGGEGATDASVGRDGHCRRNLHARDVRAAQLSVFERARTRRTTETTIRTARTARKTFPATCPAE